MVDLGTLGGTNSWASAVSATGKIIVGTSEITGNSTYDAFRWTQATGMQDLNTLLANAGVNMSGIQFNMPTAFPRTACISQAMDFSPALPKPISSTTMTARLTAL